uniref:Uncharacterized protein n=1 Tax=viral metagenome TaxID=1070528 RepID=A0A6C0C0M4_9ZZZZ
MSRSRSKRQAARSHTESLDRYDADASMRDHVTNILHFCTKDWQESQPVFNALLKVGFVTCLGCVCCFPVRAGDARIRLCVCTVRLAEAAKASGEVLTSKQIRAFMRIGQVDKRVDTLIIQDCETVAEQWRNCDRYEDTREGRTKFLSKFKALSEKHNKSPHPPNFVISEVARRFEWGAPCTKESVDEEILEEFFGQVGLQYRLGAHYGFYWMPVSNHRLSQQFTRIDKDINCNPAQVSFVVGTFVPGSIHRMCASDAGTEMLQRILSGRRKDMDVSPHPVDVLQTFLSSDHRMLVVSKPPSTLI